MCELSQIRAATTDAEGQSKMNLFQPVQRGSAAMLNRCAPQTAVPCGGAMADVLHDRLAPHIVREIEGFELQLVGRAVILRGTAPSFYTKQLVQHAVMTATDFEVVNQIRVES
jgi:hypothetical protein